MRYKKDPEWIKELTAKFSKNAHICGKECFVMCPSCKRNCCYMGLVEDMCPQCFKAVLACGDIDIMQAAKDKKLRDEEAKIKDEIAEKRSGFPGFFSDKEESN